MGSRLKRVSLNLLLMLAVVGGAHAYQTRDHPRGDVPKNNTRENRLGGPSAEPTMLHFWATWCGVCQVAEDNVQAVSKQAGVLSVASRSGTGPEVERYMTAHAVDFPMLPDPDGKLARAYGVHAYPTTFFLDREGRIASSTVGYTTTLGMKVRLWLAGL